MSAMTCRLIALLLCTLTWSAWGQTTERRFESDRMNGNVLEVRVSDGMYRFRVYSDQIIETAFIPTGQQYDPQSYAVIMQPQDHGTLHDSPAQLELSTAGMAVHIVKQPFSISYWYKGRPLIAEQRGYVKDERGETLQFKLDPDETLMGGGARALGMNRRGNRLPLYNKADYGYEQHSLQMNFSIPMVLSSRLYGILFDNAPIGYLDLDSHHDNTLTYETIGGRKNWQVVAGDSWPELMDAYTSLTGRQPLPPRWAFGNFASRFGYHSADEAKRVVDQFIGQEIPLDAVIFDLYWFGKDIKGSMGNLAFDKDNFPDPQGLINDFAARGIKTILITEPFVLTTSTRWDEAVDNKVLATGADGQPYTYDFYFGHTGLIDVFKPAARDWFWSIYRHYTEMGVAGWWGDLGEPEVHPSDLLHATGSADQLHNVYGQEWAALIADGYRKDFPGQRPFILMRAGFAGSQRYGMLPWSGDVNRTWGGLQSQPEIALQMGLQGLAYMHSDLGGFANPNLDDELYARWLQYGVFQPLFRPHAQEEVAAEPVLRDPQVRALAKRAIELRYAMLPYNYTLAFDNAQTGMPLMRPLFFAEPHNRAVYDVADSYLWGGDLLVRPVLKAGVTRQDVYFPANADWFDFYTDALHKAGSTATVDVSPDRIPLFVRAGAFLPLEQPIQNTGQYSLDRVTVHYYDAEGVAESTGKLYDDDGTTPNDFQRGAYALWKFSASSSTDRSGLRTLAITIDQDHGAKYPVTDRKIDFVIHHVTTRPTRLVLADGARELPVQGSWDGQHQLLHVTVPLKKDVPARLLIATAGSSTKSAD